MPTYIPVYQRKINQETGEELSDENGVPIMEHVRDIIVPDPPIIPIYEPTPEELAQMEIIQKQMEEQIEQSTQESPTEPDPTQNP